MDDHILARHAYNSTYSLHYHIFNIIISEANFVYHKYIYKHNTHPLTHTNTQTHIDTTHTHTYVYTITHLQYYSSIHGYMVHTFTHTFSFYFPISSFVVNFHLLLLIRKKDLKKCTTEFTVSRKK